MSPRTIITGHSVDYSKHCHLEFGTYVQTHEDHNNSMATCTTGAIALRPIGNIQGGYYFFSLSTGRVLNRNHWTALPMPAEVIARIHALARRNINGLDFGDRFGNPILAPDNAADDATDDDDETWVPDNVLDNNDVGNDDDLNHHDYDEHMFDNDINPPIAGVYDDNNNVPENHDPEMEPENEIENEVEPEIEPEDEPEPEPDRENENEHKEVDNENKLEQLDDNINKQQQQLEQQMNEQYGPRNHNYELRARQQRSFSHRYPDSSHLHTVFTHTVFTQHSMKKGIKLYGDAGIQAVLKELQQLHDCKVLEPKDPATLTRAEKLAALHYLMFLKQKRNGTIK
jgi:hypothetical protein